MSLYSHPIRRIVAAAAAVGLVFASAVFVAAPASAALPVPGTVVSAQQLDESLWIPETTAKAFKLTYVTTNAFDDRATSTGMVFIPQGRAPEGGWPVISWAHGTTGMGDECAPSLTGPAVPERDFPYLANWMKQGYAIVASDYVGLGTPGLHPYDHGRSQSHSVVDMVLAGRNFADRHLPPHQRLARKWVTIGQSQGAGASIYAARYATEFGGKTLDYRGAVGTGTPAHIEYLLTPLGPKMPPVSPPHLTAYGSYILAGLRYVHPELGIDDILTPTGEKYLKMAETECVIPFFDKLEGVSLGDYFTEPVMSLPNFLPTVVDYLGMPEDGYDKPFFMAHGILDVDVPFASTAAYVAKLEANGQPVTFKTYNNDHSGTMTESQPDTIPFVRDRFAAGS